jgi:long-chain acyl-CoA synthetase
MLVSSSAGTSRSGPAAASGSSWSTGIADAPLPGSCSTSARGTRGVRSGSLIARSGAFTSSPYVCFALGRVRLGGVNEADTGVQLIDTERLETNLADLVKRQLTAHPDGVALVQPRPVRRTVTWAELDRRVDAVAAGLSAHGLVAGHRIALAGPNSIEFVIAYLATLRAGYVAVPMNPESTVTELRAMINDCGAHVLFTSTPQPLLQINVHQIALTTEGLDELSDVSAEPVSSPRDPEALAVLLYTAGTSGEPKAAMLSHRALLSSLHSVASFEIVDHDDVLLALVPLFHVFGLNAVLGSALMSGARLVIMDGFEGFADVMAEEKITNLPLAPAVLARMLEDERAVASVESVTRVVSGAAPLSIDLREQFTARTGCRVDQGYGLTEAAPGVSATLGGELLGHGHVGRVLPGVEIKIGDGTEPSEPGEIWIRGANLFSGYWPDGHDGPTVDGWFPTGDIGYLLDEELFLVDRSRELIIVNGFNVYPAEVEEAIAELSEVSSVAVVGRPDWRTGEQVVAFVAGVDVSAAMISQHCATRLAKFKRPALIQVVAGLPRGITGKVRKGVLREMSET